MQLLIRHTGRHRHPHRDSAEAPAIDACTPAAYTVYEAHCARRQYTNAVLVGALVRPNLHRPVFLRDGFSMAIPTSRKEAIDQPQRHHTRQKCACTFLSRLFMLHLPRGANSRYFGTSTAVKSRTRCTTAAEHLSWTLAVHAWPCISATRRDMSTAWFEACSMPQLHADTHGCVFVRHKPH